MRLHEVKTDERKTLTGNCTNNKKLKITLCLNPVQRVTEYYIDISPRLFSTGNK